jgi:hypothetical protein
MVCLLACIPLGTRLRDLNFSKMRENITEDLNYRKRKQQLKGNARGSPSVFSWGSPSLIWKII